MRSMSHNPDEPVRLADLKRRRDKLMAMILQSQYLTVMTQDSIAFLAARIARALKLPPAPVETALGWLEGRRLDYEQAQHAALYCLEHAQDLESGVTPALWSGQEPAWLLSEIKDTGTAVIKDIEFAKLRLFFWTGPLAGACVDYNLPPSRAIWLLREIGYPRFERTYFNELMGSFVMLKMSSNGKGGLVIEDCRAPSALMDRNKKLYKARLGKNCRAFVGPCSLCPLGVDKCPTACRAKTTVNQKGNN